MAKVALVTGSTSGIGLAVAHALAGAGMDLALHGLVSPDEGDALAQEFKSQYQIKTLFSDADLRNADSIAGLVQRTQVELGSLDVLVNNAGIQFTAAVEDFPRQKWDDIIAINLSSAFHTIHYAVPAMKKAGWGRIVNIASVHGLVASVNKAAYVAAKHGIVGLTKVVALENVETGITCNAICPGWVDTPLIAKQIDAYAEKEGLPLEEAKRKLITDKQPMPDMTPPENIGQLVLYLCGEFARTMTGTTLPIDGAWTAQ